MVLPSTPAPATVSDSAAASMEALNAHKVILIVGAAHHQFDEVESGRCARALHSDRLTPGIIRVAPHDNFTDLVQDAVLFQLPTSLFTTLVREVSLQEDQQIHSHFLQASNEGGFSSRGPTDPQPFLAG